MATFEQKPTISGDGYTLRPMAATDADDVWSDCHDDEARRLTGTHALFTRDQIDRWCASRAEQADRLDLAVVDGTTGAWLGEVVINDWDPDNRSCGFRIALTSSARNRGIGSGATRSIVDYVFDEIDDPPVNRIHLEVYDFNSRAAAVYDRVGFTREGVLRQSLWWDGSFHDTIVMSLLRSDHERTRSVPAR